MLEENTKMNCPLVNVEKQISYFMSSTMQLLNCLHKITVEEWIISIFFENPLFWKFQC